MTPLDPNEEIDESEVMNVTGEDGIERRYRHRRLGVDHMKNGKFSNNFFQGAVRSATLVQLFFGALMAVAAVVWGVAEWTVIPQLERKIERTIAPLAARVEAAEQAMTGHRLEVAEKSRLYPTRTELKEDLDEIKQLLRDAENRR